MKKSKKNEQIVLYNKILLTVNIVVLCISSIVSVSAVSYLYSSKDVSFDKGNTTITSDNVQGAVQELYEAATDYSGLDTRIATLESDKQDKITGGATTIISNNLTASRALISNGSGKVAVSGTTSTELGYVSGVTSAIQTQLNAKAALASPTFTGTPKAPTASAGTNTTQLATTAFVKTAVSNANSKDSGEPVSSKVFYACFGNVCEVKISSYAVGNISARTTIATIPSGYRPPYETVQLLSTNGCALGVKTDGSVWIEAACKNATYWGNVVYPKWN